MTYTDQFNEPEYAIYIKVSEPNAPDKMCVRSIKISVIFPNVRECFIYYKTHQEVMENWVNMLREVGYHVYGIEIMIIA